MKPNEANRKKAVGLARVDFFGTVLQKAIPCSGTFRSISLACSASNPLGFFDAGYRRFRLDYSTERPKKDEKAGADQNQHDAMIEIVADRVWAATCRGDDGERSTVRR